MGLLDVLALWKYVTSITGGHLMQKLHWLCVSAKARKALLS